MPNSIVSHTKGHHRSGANGLSPSPSSPGATASRCSAAGVRPNSEAKRSRCMRAVSATVTAGFRCTTPDFGEVIVRPSARTR